MIRGLGTTDCPFRGCFVRSILQRKCGNSNARQQIFATLGRRCFEILSRGAQCGDRVIEMTGGRITNRRQSRRNPRKPAMQHLGSIPDVEPNCHRLPRHAPP